MASVGTEAKWSLLYEIEISEIPRLLTENLIWFIVVYPKKYVKPMGQFT